MKTVFMGIIYLIILSLLTAIGYYVAMPYAIAKRNEILQKQLLKASVEELTLVEEKVDETPKTVIFNLNYLWDETGETDLVVEINRPTLWRNFVVRIFVELTYAEGIEGLLKASEYSVPIQEMLRELMENSTVEELRLSTGKMKLKETIKKNINSILAENRVVAVYLDSFLFQ